LENIEVIFIFITNNLKNEQAIVHSISMGWKPMKQIL
jgi:hypothetical protein